MVAGPAGRRRSQGRDRTIPKTMFTATIKLADIAARSLYVLIVLYSLPARSTGQFGLVLVLIGFFAFLCGFERYLDIQRRVVGMSDANADRLIFSTLQFWVVNYLLWAPLLVGLLIFWVEMSAFAATLCLVIAVAEHLSNEVYRIALSVPRYRQMLVALLVKNAMLVAIVAVLIWWQGERFDLIRLLGVWVVMSLLGIAVAAALFMRIATLGTGAGWRHAGIERGQPYRSSRTHFLIGLVALSSLQADRLVAGSLLTLEQSGVYFRHVFLASFIYQMFNIVSYNRILPRVYAHTRAGELAVARRAIHREMKILIPGTLLLAALVWQLDLSLLPANPAIQTLLPPYLAILLFGFLVRAVADYNMLLLNAIHHEGDIFVAQSVTLVLTLVFNVILTRSFGMLGTICALVLGSGIYLITSGAYTRRSLELKNAS